MGLPGQIRVGCQDTPAFKSRYCAVHTPTAATPQGEKDSEEQIGFIIGKRSTRLSTMYEVCTKCCITLVIEKVIYTVGCVARKAGNF